MKAEKIFGLVSNQLQDVNIYYDRYPITLTFLHMEYKGEEMEYCKLNVFLHKEIEYTEDLETVKHK